MVSSLRNLQLRCMLGLFAVAAMLFAVPVKATEVGLRNRLSVASAPDGWTNNNDWTWLSTDRTAQLRALPPQWHLLVDKVRFKQVAVVVVRQNGTRIETIRSAAYLQNNWAPGGVLKFDIGTPGSDVKKLYIGFNALDDLSLMRKVTAASPAAVAAMNARWLVLMGLFAGLLVSAFVYNLLVYAGQRQPFQRWYLAWVSVALAYGLIWSNVASYVIPALAGPVAVRLNSILVGLAVALAGMFLISVLEAGKVPRRLGWTAQAAAFLCVASGVVAADERIVDGLIGDRILNYGMLASALVSLVVIAVAAKRKSRVVWIYLLGWAPVIAVFVVRLARNFGLAGQADIVDLATFAAIGFESVVFSLLIASRFTALREERDTAEATARGMQIQQETLRQAAHSDFLTGLGNRASFQAALNDLWAGASAFVLFLVDVDYLKEVNDQQGHDAGDALLQFIGSKLSKLNAITSCCARIGGDEFAILVQEGALDEAQVSDALVALQGGVWARGGCAGMLSLSIGKASSRDAVSAADVFKHADLALYEAKKGGRGQLQAYDESFRLRMQTRSDLVQQAQQALLRSEFVLYFQPVVDLRCQTVVSVEALLRWQHPSRGLLAPGSFECVLEHPKVGPAVQRRALKLAIAWLRRNYRVAGSLAVNFTAVDLRGAESAEVLLKMLQNARIPPSAFCVEVTEGTIFGKPGGEPATALRVLHAAGVRVALDDFGTGYASLVHLKEIPVDILKIDRSFVEGLLHDGGASEEIVRAVLALGHGLNKDVIAEGVENVAQLNRLRELGCVYAQGYLLGRPSPHIPSVDAPQRAA